MDRPAPDPVALLREVLGGTQHPWDQVLGAMHALRPSPESTDLLRQIAGFEEALDWQAEHGLPHAVPPEDALRSLALQILARWDAASHQELFRRVATAPGSEHVRGTAKRHLTEEPT